MKRALELFRSLERYVHRPWYIPFIAFLAFLDLFVTVIPTDALVVSAAAVRPRRWFAIGLLVSIGSTLGAVALAAFVEGVGEGWLRGAFPEFFASAGWLKASAIIDEHGGWGAFLFAIGPLPLQPAVIGCALSSMPFLKIVAWIFAGRFAKYFVFSWGASHGSKWVKKLLTGEDRRHHAARHLLPPPTEGTDPDRPSP